MKLLWVRGIIVACVMVIAFQTVQAQLTVVAGSTINMTAQQFVQTYLAGTGVTVSNATFNDQSGIFSSLGSVTCAGKVFQVADQIGLFTAEGNSLSQLQLASGIILSSGNVQNADRTRVPNGQTSVETCSGGDPDLVILGGNTSKDRTVLEFDFVPETDAVTFRYVFGSEEFDEFCGNSVNDAFGFFLSAINISGGEGFSRDAVNIALLPSLPPQPVTINNICSEDKHVLNGTYSWWNGTQPPSNPNWSVANGTEITYDRLTHVLTASYAVTCGMTHHIKIALSDIMDQIYDSGIFLEANSFSSTAVVPSPNFTNPETGQLLIPGCSNVSLVYAISQARLTDLPINLTIDPSGTATQADILPNPFPNTIIVPAGSLQSPPILIQSLPAPPGFDKELVIKASTTSCGTTSTYSNITIKYNAALVVSIPTQTICSGTSATLTPTVSGGQVFIPSNVYLYLWSNGATTPTITVSPGPGSHAYSLTVTDACGVQSSASTTVNVGNIPPAPGSITGETSICIPAAGKTYTIANVTGADSYEWTVPAGGTIIGAANGNSIVVDFGPTSVSGSLTVKGHNNVCGDGAVSSLPIVLNSVPVLIFPAISPVCVSAPPFPLIATPAGGIFTGQGVTGLSFNPGVAGNGLHTITYTYTDANGCSNSIPGSVMVYALPNVTVGSFQDICINTPAFSLTGGMPAGGTYSGTGVSGGSFSAADAGAGSHPITYTCTSAEGCVNSAVSSVQVNALPAVDFTGPVAPAGVCQDFPTPYSYMVNPTPSATYSWTIPAPFTSLGTVTAVPGSPNMADVTWNGTGSAQLKLEAITAAGCQDFKTKNILINPKPVVSLTACFDIVTTTNAKPFLLKGGIPLGNSGKYYISGTLVAGSLLDPSTLSAGYHDVAYTYTDFNGCSSTDAKTITVLPSNAAYNCTANFFTDPRNNDPNTNKYPTTLVTANGRTACWMLKNLNWGNILPDFQSQTDNCSTEKYCEPGDAACTSFGALYQWDEMMQYSNVPGWPKGICPPGWHIPTSVEWQDLIDANLGNGIAGSALKDLNPLVGFHGLLDGIFYLNSVWAFTSTQGNRGSMYWTSTLSSGKPVARGLNSNNPSVSLYESSKANAFAVRCVKD